MTFKPGQSGNPAGRPRGSRNKRTVIAEQTLDEHAAEVTQAVIDRAKNGDPTSQRMCMDRIAPPLRHRLLDFDLPELKTAGDALVASSAIIQGATQGKLTVAEANGLMRLVRGFIAILEVADFEQRLARLEAQMSEDAERTLDDDDDDDDDEAGDGADDNDVPFIPAQCPPQRANAATTPQPTTPPVNPGDPP